MPSSLRTRRCAQRIFARLQLAHAGVSLMASLFLEAGRVRGYISLALTRLQKERKETRTLWLLEDGSPSSAVIGPVSAVSLLFLSSLVPSFLLSSAPSSTPETCSVSVWGSGLVSGPGSLASEDFSCDDGTCCRRSPKPDLVQERHMPDAMPMGSSATGSGQFLQVWSWGLSAGFIANARRQIGGK